MRTLALSFAILLAAASAQSDHKRPLIFRSVRQGLLDAQVHHVPQTDELRVAQLRRTFEDLQCKGEDLREQPSAEGRNLLCTLPGTSADTILITAHYERLGRGMSVVDNWSGAIMLPFLYYALTATPRKHTFLFAALVNDKGDRGLLDSMTPAQRHNIKAVIALESLGLGPARYYLRPNGSMPDGNELYLESELSHAAEAKGIQRPESSIPGSWLKIDDTKEFRYRGVPSILIHSVDWSKRGIPGSTKDTPAVIDSNAYYETCMLLSAYVVMLDQLEIASPDTNPPSAKRR